MAEYYTYLFSAHFTPKLSYHIALHIISYIPSVELLLHMQCCQVAKVQHLIAAEYTLAQYSTGKKRLFSRLTVVTLLNSWVDKRLLSVSQVQSWARCTFYLHTLICCICSIYYPFQMQECLWPIFHMVNQRLCCSTVFHWINAYSVFLCMLG